MDDRESFGINVYTAAELSALAPPVIGENLVGPFLRRGRITLLGAMTGHGKTTFGMQMLAAGILGTDFLGWQGAGGLRVLVLDLEQALEDAQEQVAMAGLADSDLVDYAPVPEGLAINSDPAHLAEVERVVAAKPYDVVRCDPFYKLHEADSSDEREARPLVALFRRWVNAHGFALLVDTHTRKIPEGRKQITRDDFFGSSLFTRDPEIILGLQIHKPGVSDLFVFKARGRRSEIQGGQKLKLLYQSEDGFRRMPEPVDSEDAKARIVAVGADHEWRTLKEWAAVVHVGERKAETALGDLLRDGIFEYAEGAQAGRKNKDAKCWRHLLRNGESTTKHTKQVPGSGDPERSTASVLPPPKGEAPEEVEQVTGAQNYCAASEAQADLASLSEDELAALIVETFDAVELPPDSDEIPPAVREQS